MDAETKTVIKNIAQIQVEALTLNPDNHNVANKITDDDYHKN